MTDRSEAWHGAPTEVGRPDVVAIAAVAIVAFAPTVALHEAAHAVAGIAAGGHPTLMSSTDLRGDWSALTPTGFVWLGLSGSLLNWALAFLGLLAFERLDPRRSKWRLLSWLILTANGLIAAVYMTISSAVGFGDWMTILSQHPAVNILRGVASAVGLALTLAWLRLVRRTLAELVGVGPPMVVVARARRIAMVSWLTGGALAAAAALMSPLGLGWALAIAVGSTMGTTWPMLAAARSVHRTPPRDGAEPGLIEPSWALVAAAGVMAAVFVLGFGRGFTWP